MFCNVELVLLTAFLLQDAIQVRFFANLYDLTEVTIIEQSILKGVPTLLLQ